jgi:hypothetical protein
MPARARAVLFALALALALAAAPASAAPYLFASGATLRSGVAVPLVLPDGMLLPRDRVAAAIAAVDPRDVAIVAIDLGPARAVFADGGRADWPSAAFVGDPVGVSLRAPGASGFVAFPESDSLAVALAQPGAYAWRATCPRGVACPQRVLSEEVFADGFEAP